MNWKFWKKEQPKYKLTRDSKGHYHIYYVDEYIKWGKHLEMLIFQ